VGDMGALAIQIGDVVSAHDVRGESADPGATDVLRGGGPRRKIVTARSPREETARLIGFRRQPCACGKQGCHGGPAMTRSVPGFAPARFSIPLPPDRPVGREVRGPRRVRDECGGAPNAFEIAPVVRCRPAVTCSVLPGKACCRGTRRHWW